MSVVVDISTSRVWELHKAFGKPGVMHVDAWGGGSWFRQSWMHLYDTTPMQVEAEMLRQLQQEEGLWLHTAAACTALSKEQPHQLIARRFGSNLANRTEEDWKSMVSPASELEREAQRTLNYASAMTGETPTMPPLDFDADALTLYQEEDVWNVRWSHLTYLVLQGLHRRKAAQQTLPPNDEMPGKDDMER